MSNVDEVVNDAGWVLYCSRYRRNRAVSTKIRFDWMA